MITNPKISIIVPIFNVDKYLDDCLNSISNQLYENIEVLLINDGSTDNSEIIADKFIKQDKRFTLHNKQNEGTSSARNFGLDRITGSFVCFIDADDYVSNNFVTDFISIFTTTSADVVVCGRYNDYNGHFTGVFTSENISNWTGKEALINMMSWEKLDGSVCDKMFKAEDFYNLRFKPGTTGEDLPIIAKVFSKSQSIIHIGKPNYYYRQREGSTTNQSFKISKLTILESAYMVSEIVSTTFPELSKKSKQFILHHVHYLISIYLRTNILNNEDEQAFKFVRKTFFNLIPIYFLPNGRNIFKKILLLFIIATNCHQFFRKCNKTLNFI